MIIECVLYKFFDIWCCIRIGWYFDKVWNVDFRGEPTNWLMVVTPSGRWSFIPYFKFLVFLLIYGWLKKASDQGGVFALLQRLHLVTGEHLVLSDGGDCTTDSTSEGEACTDGNSSEIDETCQFRHEGRLTEHYNTGFAPLFFDWRRFCSGSLYSFYIFTYVSLNLFLIFHFYAYADQQNASCLADTNRTSDAQILRHVEIEPLFHSLALQQYILLCSQV